MMTRPASTDHSRKRRSGIWRRISPVRPSAATRPLSSVGSTWLAIRYPTSHHAWPLMTSELIQFSVPRSAWSRLVTDVVADALSVYGRNETPYFANSTSGTDHEMVASTTEGTHQASSLK